ncbi:MAG TPA: hypothetical protein VFO29_09325 [Candidatus Rubrimentiphilum sp.]|nr:hypothetical protein [Candidatus Rubrimentiphilum sp.]
MFDVADSLMGALASAKSGLATAAGGVSRSATPLGSARTESTLAQAAGQAIFTEALLNAVHARLAEIKSVAHG